MQVFDAPVVEVIGKCHHTHLVDNVKFASPANRFYLTSTVIIISTTQIIRFPRDYSSIVTQSSIITYNVPVIIED